MSMITLSAYEIAIRPLRDKDGRENLSDFANGNDLFTFLSNYIANLHEGSEESLELIDNERMKKVLRLSSDTLSPFGRQLSGIFEAGDYGYQSEIIDRTSGEMVHSKSLNHAEMIPFYFHIFIPENSQTGIIVLQRFKQYGIYGIFGETISSKFIEEFGNYRLVLNPLVSDEIINDFIGNGKLKKITLKRLNLTSEIMEMADDNEEISARTGHIEYSIVANRGHSLPLWQRIRASLRGGDRNLEGLFSINDFEYNSIAVSVRLNGHTRTMDLSSLLNIGAFFDITDEVTMDEDRGHPNLESIRAISNTIINDLYVSLNPTVRLN